jgi:hypothetical protein
LKSSRPGLALNHRQRGQGLKSSRPGLALNHRQRGQGFKSEPCPLLSE